MDDELDKVGLTHSSVQAIQHELEAMVEEVPMLRASVAVIVRASFRARVRVRIRIRIGMCIGVSLILTLIGGLRCGQTVKDLQQTREHSQPYAWPRDT